MFNIELDLPSGKKIRVPELYNRDYLSIIKFCENKDYYGLNNILSNLFITPDLDIIDRFFILIYVRMAFIGSELNFSSKKDINIKFGLGNILDNLLINYSDQERVITHDNIELKVGIPIGLYFSTIDSLYISTIRSIKLKINNTVKEINFSTLAEDEKEEILNRLPAELFVKLQSYITKLSDDLIDITLIEQNDDIGVDETRINILGNGIIYFICSIYNYDLVSFYETLYNYNHFVSNGSGDFFDLTFNEITLMLQMHAERIKKENEEAKRHDQR